MKPTQYTPTCELFVVLGQFSDCLEAHASSLASFDRGPFPRLLGVDIYYRGETNVAMVSLRFDEEQIERKGMLWLRKLAADAGFALLDPSLLNELDRRRFYDRYLNCYEVQIERFDGPRDAVLELARQIGLAEPTSRATARAETLPPPLPPRSVKNGKRRGSSPPSRPANSANRLLTVRDLEPVENAPNSGPITTVELSPENNGVPLRNRGRDAPREFSRPMTTPATPRAKTPILRKQAEKSEAIATFSGNETSKIHETQAVSASFLRGTEWIPARLRSLSMKGAYVVTGALPRNGDNIYIKLGFRGFGATVAGTVYHVTSVEDATNTGSAGFAVKFSHTRSPGKKQLVSLLSEARDAGITIKPPPPRVAVRFRVRWPMHVNSSASDIEAAALDVSTGGIFVRTLSEMPTGEVLFEMPLDNDDVAIRGRARAVRQVTQEMARERGLEPGYGLAIVELSTLDGRRWSSMLRRIQSRSQRRLVIGADSERMASLSQAITGMGYSVTGATDADGLLGLVRSSRRPPDAAVIHPSMAISRKQRHRLEEALAGLSVPLVRVGRRGPEHARLRVDRLLGVSV